MEHDKWKQSPDVVRLRREANDVGLEALRKFAHEGSDDKTLRFQSARVYEHMASVCSANQQVSDAVEMMKKASDLYEGLIAEAPGHPAYRKRYISTHYMWGILHFSAAEQARRKNDRAAADEQHAKAEKEFRFVIEQSRLALPYDDDGSLTNNLAWFLVDCPDAKLRNPAEAVPVAERAVELGPACWKIWNTLGVARYRAGQCGEAIVALKRSLELSAAERSGCASNPFFLAMAHHRLGHDREAREWYEKATKWMADHQPPDEGEVRYRREADKLFKRGAN